MPIPTTSPHDYPRLIERDRSELLSLLSGQPSDLWHRPTPCPGWSVLDLANHLLGDDLGVLARERDDHFGTPPPEGAGETEFVGFIDELNDRWVQAHRRLSPRLTIDLLSWTGPQLVELYRSQDPTEWAAHVSWASDGPVPRWLDQARELTERWIHHQQIKEALGTPVDADPALLGPVLDAFMWGYPHRLAPHPRPEGTTTQVLIHGAVERDWAFAVTDGVWQLVDTGEVPVAVLQMDADVAWRHLTNGIPPERQPRPFVDTDSELARALVRTRSIIGLPND